MTTVRLPCDDAPARTISATSTSVEPKHASWILAATILGSSIAFIDATVVNVALPALQREFGAAASDLQWVIESYGLCLAGLLLVGGALGDVYGRRLVYGIGIAVFAIASAGCGLATSTAMLIVARAVQGIGAALLVPGGLAIIGSAFNGAARDRAIGTWAAFGAITGALGPVLGGWVIEHLSWRWAFLINLPLAAIVLVLLVRFVPSSGGEKGAHLDWWGALTATIGLTGLVYALVEAPRLGAWNPQIVTAFVVGVIVLVAFVVIEWRSKAPMLPLGLFRIRAFGGANVLTLLLYAALGGSLYYVPLDLIQVQGYSAVAAGSALLPLTILLFLLSRAAGTLTQRFGARWLLTVGPALAALGFALFARPGIGESYWTAFLPAIVVLGIGMGLTVAPLTATVMGSVSQSQAGIASGVNNAVARTAGVMAIAVLGVVASGVFNRALEQRLTTVPLSAPQREMIVKERSRMAAAPVPNDWGTPLVEQTHQVIGEAFVSAFRAVMLVGAALALGAAIAGWEAGPVGSAPATAKRPGADKGSSARAA
jgi:EmrB/QacA subfamily drug resistance transporter